MDNIREFMKLNKAKPYLVFIITAVIMYSILVTALVPKKYTLNVGDIAKIDIKAPREVENTVATENNRAKAVDSVGKKTTKNPQSAEKTKLNIEKLFEAVRRLNANVTTSPADTNELSSNNNEVSTGKILSEK